MPQLEVSEEIFTLAKHHAEQRGYAAVNEYVADVLSRDFESQAENLDGLFTPERLAMIDAAKAEIDAGNFYTSDQVREHFEKKRGAFIQGTT
jgi:hypothetical protein